MNIRSIRALAIVATALLIGSTTAACKNPADGVPAAQLVEQAAPAGDEAAEGAAEEAAPEAAEEAAAGEAAVESLTFSNDGSRIDWIGAKVTLSHDGGFNEFSGTLELNTDDLSASSLSITIKMDSIWSDTEQLTEHLKSADFFGVENNPESTFATTEIREEAGEDGATHVIVGDLTMNGNTNRISFPATLAVTDEAATATAEFAINRRDWDINYDGMANDLIRNEVVIKFNISAPRG